MRGNQVIIVLGAILWVILIFVVLMIRNPNGTSEIEAHPPKESPYKCETTSDSLVPRKVVIMAGDAYLYNTTNSTRIRNLEHLDSFYIFREEGKKILVGDDPFDDKIIGYVEKEDVIFWNTRQGLLPNFREIKKMIELWEHKADVGRSSPDLYQRTDIKDPSRVEPQPIVNRDGKLYQLAALYRIKNDQGKVNKVGAFWTTLNIPEQGDLLLNITRAELSELIERMRVILQEMEQGRDSEHPIIKLFNQMLGTSFGGGLQEDLSIGELLEVNEHLPHPLLEPDMNEKQKNVTVLKSRISLCIKYLEDKKNWEKERGWIPAELLPQEMN